MLAYLHESILTLRMDVDVMLSVRWGGQGTRQGGRASMLTPCERGVERPIWGRVVGFYRDVETLRFSYSNAIQALNSDIGDYSNPE